MKNYISVENDVIPIIKPFLLFNDFVEFKENTFKNDKCEVTVLNDCYEIYSNKFLPYDEFGTMYTNNFSIYELIGILTYHKLIKRNYKTKL